jgi:hypothetical protein
MTPNKRLQPTGGCFMMLVAHAAAETRALCGLSPVDWK